MTAATQIPVEEYLRTSYDPDCEYVDGEVLERNVGEKGHSKVQKKLLLFLSRHESEWGIFVLQEWRVRLGEKHYRVPDLCIVTGPEPAEEVLSTPPLVSIEILSPEDRMPRVLAKIGGYIEAGVRYVWVLDPRAKSAFVYTSGGMQAVEDGFLRADAIEVPLSEIFD
ncbi:MAG: Uma2 family endonuclease [Bryobacteraceae bacterium]